MRPRLHPSKFVSRRRREREREINNIHQGEQRFLPPIFCRPTIGGIVSAKKKIDSFSVKEKEDKIGAQFVCFLKKLLIKNKLSWFLKLKSRSQPPPSSPSPSH